MHQFFNTIDYITVGQILVGLTVIVGILAIIAIVLLVLVSMAEKAIDKWEESK